MRFRLTNSFFSLALLLTSGALLAQVRATPGRDSATTTIAGIINSCYPGSASTVPSGAVSIPVGGVQPVGAASNTPGNLLIVVQMQGAQIDSSNSDCYGGGVSYYDSKGGAPAVAANGRINGLDRGNDSPAAPAAWFSAPAAI